MKVKTSLTLSEDLLASIDKLAGKKTSRSALIEQILRESLARRTQARRDARQVATINRHAAQLNMEMSDAFSFQASAAEGLKHEGAIQCDGLMSLEKSRLTDYVGELTTAGLRELDTALLIALGITASARSSA